ncbi:MAG: HypC/HybG/HupF family hydrogenase formation chaperone [Anaerolineae bacterium]|nr:HypC/HybG/HupF family hydrogenase formation chaperone [Anaerolineae bacterium]
MCLAIPTQIIALHEDQQATVVLGGVERQISLVMTPEAQIGDYVLIHTGYAITVMDPEEAQASLEAFAELAQIQEEMETHGLETPWCFQTPNAVY